MTLQHMVQYVRDEDRKWRNAKIILKNNGKNQWRYLDKTKEKEKREENIYEKRSSLSKRKKNIN